MTDLVRLREANARRFLVAKPMRSFSSVARALVDPVAKARYQAVSAKTGVPWAFIAVVHEREASQSWKGNLAQGDPWNEVSTHIPAGHGPFTSWESAAVDALTKCAPFAARNTDWSPGGFLTMLEQYNGLGYAARGMPSPYVWSGTDQYRSGKYIRDGVYDPDAIDRQFGCAGLLMAMMEIDKSITFSAPAAVPVPAAPSPPSFTKPAVGSIGAAIAAVIKGIVAIFKRSAP